MPDFETYPTDLGDIHYTHWNEVINWLNAFKEGIATITAGNTEVTVTHNKGAANYPTVTPIDEPESFWYVDEVTTNSFKIKSQASFSDKRFNYRC